MVNNIGTNTGNFFHFLFSTIYRIYYKKTQKALGEVVHEHMRISMIS